jgi:hypothetical protein
VDDNFDPTAHAKQVLKVLTEYVEMANDRGFSPPAVGDLAWRDLRLVASGTLNEAEAREALRRVLPAITDELARVAEISARMKGKHIANFHPGTETLQ